MCVWGGGGVNKGYSICLHTYVKPNLQYAAYYIEDLFYCYRTMRKTESLGCNVWRRPVTMVTEKPCYTWHVLLTLVLDWPVTGETLNYQFL